MLNFTVGPVTMDESVRAQGAEQIPYFRTPEFSSIMLENEMWMKQFSHAESDARAVFLTGSGTAAMEAAVMHAFTPKDKVLVINGGSFGQRFAELCAIHGVPYTEIHLQTGCALHAEQLDRYDGMGYTGLLVNAHETSTGVHYDMPMLSRFCKKNGLFWVTDAISSFLADEIDMAGWGIDMLLTGSQKALACPPGVSVVVLSPRAVERVKSRDVPCMYLNLKSALKNGERGQTPFTPAVGTLLQIHTRLAKIHAAGGAAAEIARVGAQAADFRAKIAGLPLDVVSESMSNAVTPLHPQHASAYDVFTALKNEYQIWVCPNGGALAEQIFRVGHIGALTPADNTVLVETLHDMNRRNLL